MPDFRPRPRHMATTSQLGRPAHMPATVAQSNVQVQAASNASAVESALIDLGGDYAATPGALQAQLEDFQSRLTALEDVP